MSSLEATDTSPLSCRERVLLVAEDFAAGTPAKITVPASHEFQVGDKVTIHPVGTATLDTGFTTKDPGGDALAMVSAVAAEEITVVEPADGAAITFAGDATGSDQANHFEISLSEYGSICSIKEYSLSLERESIDITTLPCKPCEEAGSKYASFHATAPGYAAAEGSMTNCLARIPTLLLTACWLTACWLIRQALPPSSTLTRFVAQTVLTTASLITLRHRSPLTG